MSLSFTSVVYEDNNQSCVSWSGLQCSNNDQFSKFLTTKVASRLDDSEGNDEFRSHLNGLALTGLGKDSLAEVLNADHPEERAWAAGEALAEAYLEEEEDIVFPWNMERDKRNPFGSLPGADIVGFVGDDTDCRFVLGEVKSSSEHRYPPQIMSGRSGHMGHQLDNLAGNLTTICQLLKWLLPRVKNTVYQPKYDQAAASYFNSGNKKVKLFGVLVRDTEPNASDLSGRGSAVRQELSVPTNCRLIALYLPFGLDQLIDQIREGGAS